MNLKHLDSFMKMSHWHLLGDHSEDYRGTAPEGHWVVPLIACLGIIVLFMAIGWGMELVFG